MPSSTARPACGAGQARAKRFQRRRLRVHRTLAQPIRRGPGAYGRWPRHPRRQCCQERALHGIFHHFKVVKPHAADQYRHQPAVLVPEVVFHQARR